MVVIIITGLITAQTYAKAAVDMAAAAAAAASFRPQTLHCGLIDACFRSGLDGTTGQEVLPAMVVKPAHHQKQKEYVKAPLAKTSCADC